MKIYNLLSSKKYCDSEEWLDTFVTNAVENFFLKMVHITLVGLWIDIFPKHVNSPLPYKIG